MTVGPREWYILAVVMSPNCGEQAGCLTTGERLREEPPSCSLLGRGPVARALQKPLQSAPSLPTPSRLSR